MDNLGRSKKPLNSATPDDIPEALRETSEPGRQFPLALWLIGGGVMVGLIAIAFATVILNRPTPTATITTPTTTVTATQPSPGETPIDNVLGHLPYPEAPASELAPISPDGRLQMRQAAAKQFLDMKSAARAQGVILVPISGFRTVSEQQHLFFDVKAQRRQDATKRAEVSAPPGYSEHHTGYAVDIGDGNVPATNLSPSFEQTAAFKWMEKNAAIYSFEMSFPQNNKQGVSYEPWHWRFVGDRPSLEMFYKARNLRSTP